MDDWGGGGERSLSGSIPGGYFVRQTCCLFVRYTCIPRAFPRALPWPLIPLQMSVSSTENGSFERRILKAKCGVMSRHKLLS